MNAHMMSQWAEGGFTVEPYETPAPAMVLMDGAYTDCFLEASITDASHRPLFHIVSLPTRHTAGVGLRRKVYCVHGIHVCPRPAVRCGLIPPTWHPCHAPPGVAKREKDREAIWEAFLAAEEVVA